MQTYLDYADIERMEQAAGCLRDSLLIRLLFRLGCRVSEALALKQSDIDFTLCTVTILHLKRRLRLSCPNCKAHLGKRHQFCPNCGVAVTEAMQRQQEHRRVRVLPIDRQTSKMLGAYIKVNKPGTSIASLRIFSINRHRAWQVVRDCAKRAGLPNLLNPETGRVRGVSPHRLRDAFSVHAMKSDDSGDALRLLQEHLGHASFNTTARYRKIAGEEHREWYDSLWGQSA